MRWCASYCDRKDGCVTDEDLSYSSLGWIVPEDDTHYHHFFLYRVGAAESHLKTFETLGFLKDEWGPSHGKPFREWSLEDHQQWQTDYVTQKGQGDITLHSEEHLTVADTGIGMTRRMFKRQAALVASGGDPVGAGPGFERLIDIRAGNAFLDPETGAMLVGITPPWEDL